MIYVALLGGKAYGRGKGGGNVGVKTKIDWADATWNPVTGCLHGCEYCYARSIANRFGGHSHGETGFCVGSDLAIGPQPQQVLYAPKLIYRKNKLQVAPYPWYFTPTFHRYLLDKPRLWKTRRTIFVCSMADLFGDWVPDEWIKDVFDACDKAPWHRYIFLTKNPTRYLALYDSGIMPKGVNGRNKWFGSTVTNPSESFFYNDLCGSGIDHNGFLSIEPIMEDFPVIKLDCDETGIKWIIVGAETGNRKGKIIPKKGWINHLAETCDKSAIPIFMKESLHDLMGDDFRQETPWK